jgi:cytosine/adenosine deaminase-related metal-dependent hydrolase
VSSALAGGDRGSCRVERKGRGGVLINGRLLLPSGAVDGQLLVGADGIIRCAGPRCDGGADATVVTCEKAVISPGLINAHDHITFANTPPRGHGQERYEHRHDWRKGLRGHTKISTLGTGSANAQRAAELRFLLTGVTSAASAGGQPGLIRNLDGREELMQGLHIKPANSDTFPMNDSGPGGGWPFASCDQFSSSRRTAEQIAGHDGYLPHVSEGIDAIAHLEIGCISNAAQDPQHLLLAKQTAIIHGVAVQARDVVKLREAQTALVWSPRSNVDLYGNTAPVVLYDNAGVQIALGTDWLPSGSMNMSRELKCADDLNRNYFGGHFSDEALWRMVTTNAAFAVGAKDALGMLKPGYAADIVIFDAARVRDHRAVIEASAEDVILVARGGRTLYGDASLMVQGGLGAESCEDLDVCGVRKKVCVSRDLGGMPLSSLVAEAASTYPLFSCRGDTPRNEPSCLPSRGPTASSSEASVYASSSDSDGDGDGVNDGDDLCPSVFDPVRPLDDGRQADSDGDGIGDACDRCPLQSGESCPAVSGNDIDGDGVGNGADTCPEIADPGQADRDHDGKGDACDPCPDAANPGQNSCPG